jgi:ferritin
LEDIKFIPVSEILRKLHHKFGQNLSAANQYSDLAIQHESRARVLGIVRNFLEGKANLKHQHEIAVQFDEIFSDSTIALYLAFSGLNVPACMLARRSLELGLVLISGWDKPADYWAWMSHDEDVSFSKLVTYISSSGYKSFLQQEGELSIQFDKVIEVLPDIYSKLSNVVHPKIYNFETNGEAAFSIIEADLRKTLLQIEDVQKCLLTLLASRFKDFDVTKGAKKTPIFNSTQFRFNNND